MLDYTKELEIAKKAAFEAADLIREFQEQKKVDIDFKGRNDLVTNADIAAEEKILEIIRSSFPNDNIMAEESAAENVVPEDRTWIVDPIDGTTNFAHNFPIYCVSIGFWENSQAHAGVVFEVSNGELFEAVRGNGAYCDGEQVQVSATALARDSLIGTGFPYNDLSLVDNYVAFFRWLMEKTQALRRPGAASYDLCCVAAGRFDGFYEYSLKPWDVGAASLIVEEAGGVISDWNGGENWLFGERLVAGNPQIHDFLLKAIKEHFTDEERLH